MHLCKSHSIPTRRTNDEPMRKHRKYEIGLEERAKWKNDRLIGQGSNNLSWRQFRGKQSFESDGVQPLKNEGWFEWAKTFDIKNSGGGGGMLRGSEGPRGRARRWRRGRWLAAATPGGGGASRWTGTKAGSLAPDTVLHFRDGTFEGSLTILHLEPVFFCRRLSWMPRPFSDQRKGKTGVSKAVSFVSRTSAGGALSDTVLSYMRLLITRE